MKEQCTSERKARRNSHFAKHDESLSRVLHSIAYFNVFVKIQIVEGLPKLEISGGGGGGGGFITLGFILLLFAN